MITIIKSSNNKFELDGNNSERDTIEYLQEEFPRKLERFIEIYLAERKRNREAAEDMEIVATMSPGELNVKRLALRADKNEKRRIEKEKSNA